MELINHQQNKSHSSDDFIWPSRNFARALVLSTKKWRTAPLSQLALVRFAQCKKVDGLSPSWESNIIRRTAASAKSSGRRLPLLLSPAPAELPLRVGIQPRFEESVGERDAACSRASSPHAVHPPSTRTHTRSNRLLTNLKSCAQRATLISRYRLRRILEKGKQKLLAFRRRFLHCVRSFSFCMRPETLSPL